MKIRIKVALNGEGQWSAAGWSGASDKDPDNVIYEAVYDEGGIATYWINAEIPDVVIPEIKADSIELTPSNCIGGL